MRRLLALSVFLILMTACGKPAPSASETSTPEMTAGPSATPTPGKPLVMMILPADMPADEAALYQTTIADLAQTNGMRYQLLNILTPQDIQLEAASLKIVIALPPDPGLADLASAAPSVQFLGVNIPGLTAAPNLSTIGADGPPVDRQAFMAGYIGAMVADDYTVGILSRDDASGLNAEIAFQNGMVYYCGLCQRAFWTPYTYPVHIEVPVDEQQTRYPAYAEPFVNNIKADVVFVYPDLATSDLLDSMAQKGLNIISEDMPEDYLQPNWIASLKPELIPAIQRIFPELLAGSGGQSLAIPLVLEDVNTDRLTEGKLQLAQKTLDDLQAGFIGTGISP